MSNGMKWVVAVCGRALHKLLFWEALYQNLGPYSILQYILRDCLGWHEATRSTGGSHWKRFIETRDTMLPLGIPDS